MRSLFRGLLLAGAVVLLVAPARAADDPNPAFRWGTYMVFQKVLHDLDQWRELEVDEQQEWVGRSKATGLLLGTLDEDDVGVNGFVVRTRSYLDPRTGDRIALELLRPDGTRSFECSPRRWTAAR